MSINKIITEKDISKKVGRLIESPIRVASLRHLGIDQEAFIQQFSPYFAELPWDPYDARRLQLEFLKNKFPKESHQIQQYFAEYFTGQISIDFFQQWISRLSPKDKQSLDQIQPWRRRSIAQFMVEKKQHNIIIKREPVQQYAQDLDKTDFRSLPRIFEESPTHHVENEQFNYLISNIFQMVQAVKTNVRKARMTAHFMSVKATQLAPGDNSPEGAHEDGADFIVSALVISRINVVGGETQILEQFSDGKRELIFKHTLQPGEFVFQADTREEVIYGNDLWHHVTPFALADKNQPEGWRNIIGFDISTG